MRIAPHEESFGTVTFPEGFAQRLEGLTILQQMDCYRTTTCSRLHNTDWKKRTMDHGYARLENTPEIKALIVRDEVLVGVMILDDNGREQPCLPEGWVCTCYSEDNNGAGYKSYSSFTHLVCVPEGFGLR